MPKSATISVVKCN